MAVRVLGRPVIGRPVALWPCHWLRLLSEQQEVVVSQGPQFGESAQQPAEVLGPAARLPGLGHAELRQHLQDHLLEALHRAWGVQGGPVWPRVERERDG